MRGAELAFLAGIENGEFAAIGDPAAQGGGVDPAHQPAGATVGRMKFVLYGTSVPVAGS